MPRTIDACNRPLLAMATQHATIARTRLFSTLSPVYNRTPRFVNTLKEASKLALTKSEPITKPFGFDDKVTLQDTSESILKMFSKKKRDRRLRQLDHDIVHSPFYESKSFTNTKGKIFTPPVSYFKQDRAKYFPNVVATSLLGNKRELYALFADKVSLVRIYTTLSGENCTKTYLDGYLDEAGYVRLLEEYPNVQIVDLSLPQSWIKGVFLSMGSGTLRRSLPKARQDMYFTLAHGYFDVDTRKALKCDNACSGYLYVVDEQAKIRWATSGNATDSEKEILWMTVRGLERELLRKEADE